MIHLPNFIITCRKFHYVSRFKPETSLLKLLDTPVSFCVNYILTIGEKHNKKNIESLNLTRKVNIFRLWRKKIVLLTCLLMEAELFLLECLLNSPWEVWLILEPATNIYFRLRFSVNSMNTYPSLKSGDWNFLAINNLLK